MCSFGASISTAIGLARFAVRDSRTFGDVMYALREYGRNGKRLGRNFWSLGQAKQKFLTGPGTFPPSLRISHLHNVKRLTCGVLLQGPLLRIFARLFGGGACSKRQSLAFCVKTTKVFIGRLTLLFAQIYVGNLEPSVTEDDLREFFAECGDIASVSSTGWSVFSVCCMHLVERVGYCAYVLSFIRCYVCSARVDVFWWFAWRPRNLVTM